MMECEKAVHNFDEYGFLISSEDQDGFELRSHDYRCAGSKCRKELHTVKNMLTMHHSYYLCMHTVPSQGLLLLIAGLQSVILGLNMIKILHKR